MKRYPLVFVAIVAILGCREREPQGRSQISVTTVSPTPRSSAQSVQIEVDPPKPEPGVKSAIRVRFPDTPPRLEPISGKPVHLIIVNRDLSWMKHLHPQAHEATYSTVATFPEADEYVFFAMFQPAGAERKVVTSRIFAGALVDQHAPPRIAVTPLSRKSGSYVVELKRPEPLRARSWSTLTFRITKRGLPVTNLVATDSPGDLIVVREGAVDFVYAHSAEGEAAGGIRGRLHAPAKPPGLSGTKPRDEVSYFGPDVTFHTRFPAAGRYRLSLEVTAATVPINADFVIDVLEPAPPSDDH